jgi:hypothetical protein
VAIQHIYIYDDVDDDEDDDMFFLVIPSVYFWISPINNI